MTTDPYSSPVNMQPSRVSAGDALSSGVLAQLAGTKPWVRFMAVLMFLGAGFMLLAALIMLVAGGSIAAANKGASGAMPGGLMTGLAVLYAVFSVVYIYPALKLWKYATRIGALLVSGNMSDLESALSQQRSFWKFVGIMIIAIFVLYLVAGIAVVAFGGMAAMKAQGL